MSKKNPSSLFSINTFLGVIFGIIISLLVFVAVTYYVNKSEAPYFNLSNFERQAAMVDSLAEGAFEESAPPLLWQENRSQPEESEPIASQATPSEVIVPSPEASKEVARIEDFASPAEIEPPLAATSGVFYVQAGVFDDANNADERKAQLALLGVSASVTPVNFKAGVTRYRVRIGPFTSEEQAKKIADRVRGNGIQPYLIRPQ